MKKLLIILLSLLCMSADMRMQQEDTNAKIKAVFLYNFTKYIEWPQAYKEGNFVIGILGNNSNLVTELNKMAAQKMAGNQKIEIRLLTTADGANKCHIVFIQPDKGNELGEVIGKCKGKSSLIVTEKAGLARQGAAINFVVQESKQKFELNRGNAEKYNLKVSSNLASLAIVVD
jgi:Fe-S cluster assembly iron-binding protein IscA